MSENAEVQAEVAETSYAHEESSVDLGEFVIAALGGLVMFGFVYGVMAALVAIVRVSENPGWTVQQFMDVLKLVPPEGVSLSGLPAISFTPPAANPWYWIYEFALLNVSWVVGLFGAWWGYNKVLNLPDTDAA